MLLTSRDYSCTLSRSAHLLPDHMGTPALVSTNEFINQAHPHARTMLRQPFCNSQFFYFLNYFKSQSCFLVQSKPNWILWCLFEVIASSKGQACYVHRTSRRLYDSDDFDMALSGVIYNHHTTNSFSNTNHFCISWSPKAFVWLHSGTHLPKSWNLSL